MNLPLQISYDRLNAVPVILAPHKQLRLYLVGCGGTGGWLAPSLVRLTKILTDQGYAISLTLIDHDHVEKSNIPRQNFLITDLGLNKAQILALRYGVAYGVDVRAIPERFNPEMVQSDYNTLSIVIGCVDNGAARQAIAKTLQANHPTALPRVWWLDGGNTRTKDRSCLAPGQHLKHLHLYFAHFLRKIVARLNQWAALTCLDPLSNIQNCLNPFQKS
jgi:PRTRC genetic system ThiF family protein